MLFHGETQSHTLIYCIVYREFQVLFLLPSIRSRGAPRKPEEVLNDSSDSETKSDSLWGQQGSPSPRVLQNQSMLDPPEREGLDKELQTFISMRDQTDQATEVGEDGCNFMIG